eukprot:9114799-Pyramimonas_sp.AAC.1
MGPRTIGISCRRIASSLKGKSVPWMLYHSGRKIRSPRAQQPCRHASAPPCSVGAVAHFV